MIAYITNLLCNLANINQDSIVYDNWSGTVNFLVPAMAKMVAQDKDNIDKIN